MKFGASLVLLATSALANQFQQRGGDNYHPGKTTTLTTYTTVTTCPVTSTYTQAGSTYVVTKLTTSTVVVTDCHGCGAGVTTVQGPDKTKTEEATQYVTRTTVCPVTETKTIGGKETTVTFTTTSTIVEPLKSTIWEVSKQPDVTKTAEETQFTTITTICPVTQTTVIGGKETTLTYTTTSTIVQPLKSTIWEVSKQPDVTKSAEETQFTTITSICPVTQTTVIGGKETTLTFTTTSTIVQPVKSTVWEVSKQPDVTKTAEETQYITRTSLCPVTQTTVIGGKETTLTFTTLSTIVEPLKTTVWEVSKQPDQTKTQNEVGYVTRTSLCPVTQTTVIGGKQTTIIYTSTSTIIEPLKTTIWEVSKQPDVTKTQQEVAYFTSISLCPVTETQTIQGQVVTKVYTSTQYIVGKKTTTLQAYQTVYQTKSSKVTITVNGGDTIETVVPVTTVQIPQTEVVTKPGVTRSAAATTPSQVVVNSAAVAEPHALAFVVGLLAAIVF